MPAYNRIKKDSLIVFKIHRNHLYLVLIAFVFFLASTFLFYFVKKQENLQKKAILQQQLEQAKKNDAYWRNLGEEIAKKLKKNSSVNQELVGIEGKNFQDSIAIALGYFKKAKELNSASYENWLAIARFYDFLIPYVAGSENDAAESYLYIIKNFPVDFNVMRYAVRVLIINSDKSLLVGKNAASVNSLNIASKISKSLSQNDPVNLYGKYYSALIARRQKDYNFATTTLEQIKPFLNKEPDLFFELGQAYLATNQFEKARENFIEASKLSTIYQKNSEVYLRIIEEKLKQKTSSKRRD